MFRLLTLVWLVNSNFPGLVDNWKFYDGHAYAFIDQSMTWHDAANVCGSLYMDMATPTSNAELEFLEEAAYNGDDNIGYLNSWFWIGASNEHVHSKVTAYQAARGWYWARWTWDNGETWSYQDFDGEMESGDWGYDNYGAALIVTDFDSAASSTYPASWRIAPASNAYKVVCESR